MSDKKRSWVESIGHLDSLKDIRIVGDFRSKPFTVLMPKEGFKPGDLSHLQGPCPPPSEKSNLVLNVLMDAYRKGQVEPKVVVDAEGGERTVFVVKEKP